ncbi:hypothetical protein FBY31_2505 [Arthrobacter sp. SLBN-100]|nr:hypothetical protein FBY31_2505 [Arthrobacter sp. SLBN-100]
MTTRHTHSDVPSGPLGEHIRLEPVQAAATRGGCRELGRSVAPTLCTAGGFSPDDVLVGLERTFGAAENMRCRRVGVGFVGPAATGDGLRVNLPDESHADDARTGPARCL